MWRSSRSSCGDSSARSTSWRIVPSPPKSGSRFPLAELLFWPALLLYGEAAVGYFGDARRPGNAGRVATWGVRLGWLVQTALLAVQAARENGFPWGTWAGSLNLFFFLGCRAMSISGCAAGR